MVIINQLYFDYFKQCKIPHLANKLNENSLFYSEEKNRNLNSPENNYKIFYTKKGCQFITGNLFCMFS